MKTHLAHTFPLIIAALASGFAASPAVAERADREKPITLEANRVNVDEANKVHVYEGNVVLSQGTLVIRADKLVVTQDADGFQTGVATGGPGGLARFRQKREASEEIMEGEGERIVHSAKTEKTEFFHRAWVRSGLDEVKGNYISYDGLTEKYLVTSGVSADGKGPAKADGGRVRAVIQPKSKSGEEPPKGDPLKLKPTTSKLPVKE